MKVIFVCTGNTCRSPMAEGIYNKLSGGAISRGLMVYSESNPSENAIKVMEKRGIDIKSHTARQLTEDEVRDCDIVLTMTKSHKDVILRVMPEAKDKVFTLGEKSGGGEVVDPYGQSEEVYDACAEALEGYIKEFIDKYDNQKM